jgi:hypothetical protein
MVRLLGNIHWNIGSYDRRKINHVRVKSLSFEWRSYTPRSSQKKKILYVFIHEIIVEKNHICVLNERSSSYKIMRVFLHIRRHTATKTIIAARGVSTRQGGGATQNKSNLVAPLCIMWRFASLGYYWIWLNSSRILISTFVLMEKCLM